MPDTNQEKKHLIGVLEHPEKMTQQEIEDYAINVAAIRDMAEMQKSGAKLVGIFDKDTTPEQVKAAAWKTATEYVNQMIANGEFPGETEPLPEPEEGRTS